MSTQALVACTGPSGPAGHGCSVHEEAGVKVLSCGDGTRAVIDDGADGEGCFVADNDDGTKTITCADGTSVVVRDGEDGEDGVGCTAVDNGDGTKTISCEDGTSVIVRDGEDGEDGVGCTVVDNGDGTKTITCADGTSVVIRDGVICEPGDSRECYSGPEGTLGVGTCAAGLQFCEADGKSWGDCEGDVVPQLEACGQEEDVDCDGTVTLDVDEDGDGFSTCGGDCCDSTEVCDQPQLVNPGAMELPQSDGVDQDCNGTVDDSPLRFCSPLAEDEPGPAAAKALELCIPTVDSLPAPGLLDAVVSRFEGDSAPLQLGTLMSFGSSVIPQSGAHMVALSTGHARATGQVGYCSDVDGCVNTTGAAVLPAGFPQRSESCQESSPSARDDVVLTLRLRVPTNATGYAFRYAYFTDDHPDALCSQYEDQFVVLASPPPVGAVNGNIALGVDGLPPSAGPFNYCQGCPDGTYALAGTGFDEGAATDWRLVTADATPGSLLTLQFAIWDSGDALGDSTVLLDDFHWLFD